MGKALPGLLAYRFGINTRLDATSSVAGSKHGSRCGAVRPRLGACASKAGPLHHLPRQLAIAALACCAAAAAAAERAPISLRDAAAIVQQAYGGRVVSASPGTRRTTAGAERGYWIRVDVRGRIKTVFVDLRGRIHENARPGFNAGCRPRPCACC